MAERSGFFPFVEGDTNTAYDNDFLAKWVHSLISDGIYNGDFAVTAAGNMTITVPIGQAWINGYYYHNDAPITFTLTPADGILARKDVVVLRWNINSRKISAQVITGTLASNPTAPKIVRTAEQFDLKLCEIYVGVGATSISKANITDTRLDNTVCGIVHAVVDHIDTTTIFNRLQAFIAERESQFGAETSALFNQLQEYVTGHEAQFTSDMAAFESQSSSDFNTWFDGVKAVLDGDTVGNLLSLINANTTVIEGKAAKSTIVNATLTAAGWAGTAAPYSQTISVSDVTTTNVNEILPSASITSDQLAALQAANLQDGGQSAGSITLKAWGDKPIIDLPIRVIVRGDM